MEVVIVTLSLFVGMDSHNLWYTEHAQHDLHCLYASPGYWDGKMTVQTVLEMQLSLVRQADILGSQAKGESSVLSDQNWWMTSGEWYGFYLKG